MTPSAGLSSRISPCPSPSLIPFSRSSSFGAPPGRSRLSFLPPSFSGSFLRASLDRSRTLWALSPRTRRLALSRWGASFTLPPPCALASLASLVPRFPVSGPYRSPPRSPFRAALPRCWRWRGCPRQAQSFPPCFSAPCCSPPEISGAAVVIVVVSAPFVQAGAVSSLTSVPGAAVAVVGVVAVVPGTVSSPPRSVFDTAAVVVVVVAAGSRETTVVVSSPLFSSRAWANIFRPLAVIIVNRALCIRSAFTPSAKVFRESAGTYGRPCEQRQPNGKSGLRFVADRIGRSLSPAGRASFNAFDQSFMADATGESRPRK